MTDVLLFHHALGATAGVHGGADGLGDRLVVTGFSLGALPAQELTTGRTGPRVTVGSCRNG